MTSLLVIVLIPLVLFQQVTWLYWNGLFFLPIETFLSSHFMFLINNLDFVQGQFLCHHNVKTRLCCQTCYFELFPLVWFTGCTITAHLQISGNSDCRSEVVNDWLTRGCQRGGGGGGVQSVDCWHWLSWVRYGVALLAAWQLAGATSAKTSGITCM